MHRPDDNVFLRYVVAVKEVLSSERGSGSVFRPTNRAVAAADEAEIGSWLHSSAPNDPFFLVAQWLL